MTSQLAKWAIRWMALTGLAALIIALLSAWKIESGTSSANTPRKYDSYAGASALSSNYVIAAKWEQSEVTYSFLNCPTNMGCETAKQAVRESAESWDSVCGLALTEIASNGDIAIGWFSGAHGDGEPFDGLGNVLAHAFFPKSFLGDLAGDLHFDADEHWVIGSGGSGYDVDLRTTAIHELGHSLGLDHSGDPNAIMWDEYTGERGLGSDDIAGIQALYGPPSPDEGQTSPSPTGITATSTVAAKIRTGPGISFTEIGVVAENTTVGTLGRNAASDWLFIDYQGLQGWTAGWLFTLNGDINALPVVDQTGGSAPPTAPPTEPTAPGAVTALALDNAKMRQGPDISYAEVGKIPRGATVNVIARNDGYNWIVVEYNGTVGWAAAWLFRVNGSLASLPVQ